MLLSSDIVPGCYIQVQPTAQAGLSCDKLEPSVTCRPTLVTNANRCAQTKWAAHWHENIGEQHHQGTTISVTNEKSMFTWGGNVYFALQ